MSRMHEAMLFSTVAGLSTGLGGLIVLFFRQDQVDLGVIAAMLGTAASAMITVSFVDLFWNVAIVIGLSHAVGCCCAGFAVVVAARRYGPNLMGNGGFNKAEESSDLRLRRLGIITAITLTCHNLPEGMAVALSTMGSTHLGLRMAFAIALHNIPEGLAIAGPLMMSRKTSRLSAIGLALASGLSEPVGALMTLIFFKHFITETAIDHALAFVGGVMIAVASLELIPEALRVDRPVHTATGCLLGTIVMGASLQYLAE